MVLPIFDPYGIVGSTANACASSISTLHVKRKPCDLCVFSLRFLRLARRRPGVIQRVLNHHAINNLCALRAYSAISAVNWILRLIKLSAAQFPLCLKPQFYFLKNIGTWCLCVFVVKKKHCRGLGAGMTVR